MSSLNLKESKVYHGFIISRELEVMCAVAVDCIDDLDVHLK